MTIPALLRIAAERFGETDAVIDGDIKLSYAQLHKAVRRFAAAMVTSGIEPGDRVAIWAPNSAPWVIAYLGLSSAGATLVPVNTRFKGIEAAQILARSRARALVTVTRPISTPKRSISARATATGSTSGSRSVCGTSWNM